MLVKVHDKRSLPSITKMWSMCGNVETEVQNKKGKCLLKVSFCKKKKKERLGYNPKKEALS